MLLKRNWLALFIVFVFAGCAENAQNNSFKVDQAEFYGKIRKIAILPVIVPAKTENQEEVKGKFETLIDDRLKKAGFSTIPSVEYEKVWKKISQNEGGFYSAYTGELDKAKFNKAVQAAIDELDKNFGIDAVIAPRVCLVQVPFSGSNVYWHGISEPVTTTLVFGRKHQGTIGALSLQVMIIDRKNNLVYKELGGIQLAQKLSIDSIGVQIVQSKNLLSIDKLNEGAVDIVFKDLMTASQNEKGKGE